MSESTDWLASLRYGENIPPFDGLLAVDKFQPANHPPEVVALMLKAKDYSANAVFFEAGRNGRPPVAQAFVYVSDGPANDPDFGKLHRRLWSWGGVPLVYRKTLGLVQLFRCAHKPDFIAADGEKCSPFKTLKLAGKISSDPWWDHWRLRNGTIWDDPKICRQLLSENSAHKRLLTAVKELYDELNEKGLLRKHLRRKLLILSLLIAYLEEREVLVAEFFGQFYAGATKFFEVLPRAESLISLLAALEVKFNGNVFALTPADAESLRDNSQLASFARLVEAKQENTGQRTLWELYSFKDLPIELISHIYQMFVEDKDTAVYTPPFLVRLMLDEALDWKRLDWLNERDDGAKNGKIIADFSCGSGVFLVEAYKRLVLHWRSRNEWKLPGQKVLKNLLKKVHGIDLEPGAVELTAFSLYLAMCDALEPEEIRSSIKLFPPLEGVTLHPSCFFEAVEKRLINEPIGIVVGNPPFKSKLTTGGAVRSYDRHAKQYGEGSLPDTQLGYLFLHEAMELIAEGGILCMLQQYGFLYNQGTLKFRQRFIEKWDIREILDFISVRGLFQRGDADTKVIVVVAERNVPPNDRKILHATFRRTGRADAERGFDIDFYDLHWLPRSLALNNESVWRCNLLGGGRVLAFIDRLKKYRTLGQFAETQKKQNEWDFGEGFIEGQQGISRPADHIIGKPNLPSTALTLQGVDEDAIIAEFPNKSIEGPRSTKRFSAPMLLLREQMDLPHAVWKAGYLTYKNKIVGFCAPENQCKTLVEIDEWISDQAPTLRAFLAGVSVRLFTQKATTLSEVDILAIPYPVGGRLDLSSNERIIASDIVDYFRDLVRLGEKSLAMKNKAAADLAEFVAAFTDQINSIYKKSSLRALDPLELPGVICQPFVFGNGEVDWTDAASLQSKLDSLLHEQKSSSLHITRIARIYDGRFIFLLKPDRLRFWLRSIALRDADETLADLRAQGF